MRRGQQTFTGGIDGTGAIDWLLAYRADKTASFVGIQRIEASVDGRRGSIVLTSIGRFTGAESEGQWEILEGSGDGELAGISGTGDWRAGPGPNGTYRLTYQLD
jgi:Protein of unknown function (DUF3224)